MFKRFFNFDIFITTTVVKILYAIVCVLMILAGLATVVMSLFAFGQSFGAGIQAFLTALLVLIIGVPLYFLSRWYRNREAQTV